jgi:hypothetical protein
MDNDKTEKIGKDKCVGYPFRYFNISMKGLKQHVGHLGTPVHVLRRDMKTIEEIYVHELTSTGECVAVMFYNSVVYLEVPSSLGIKTLWCERYKTRIYHYALLEGFEEPIYWNKREDHPNYKAHDIGFNFGREQNWGCINGKPIDWFRWTDTIDKCEIYVYENGQRIIPLEKTGCYKCADGMKIHMEETKKCAVGDLDNKIRYYEGLITKAKEEINSCTDNMVYLEKARDNIMSLSPANIWEKHPEFRK